MHLERCHEVNTEVSIDLGTADLCISGGKFCSHFVDVQVTEAGMASVCDVLITYQNRSIQADRLDSTSTGQKSFKIRYLDLDILGGTQGNAHFISNTCCIRLALYHGSRGGRACHVPCRFHGIEPSKKSKEKIQRKVRDEMAAKKMATSEQPTGSFSHLKNAQVSQYQIHLPASGTYCPAAATSLSCLIRGLCSKSC